jgi:tRNA dimethylallyltransferase
LAGRRSPQSPPSTLVLGLFGPTASGKTDVAEAIADRVPAELISADAMQVYRGLPILSNQSERPARLVGIWPLSHEASVAEYQRLAHAAVDEVLAAGKLPVVVGGTGLWLRAALADLELPPAPEEGVRERWQAVYDEAGAQAAHDRLAELDPAAAAAMHANDRRRVVRALELAEAGHSLAPASDRLWSADTRHPTLIVGLDVPAEVVARRIEERARAMWERGVEDEVRRALAGTVSRTAEVTLGLREVAELPREEAETALVARTRRYAAYQRKWMRRIPGLISVRADRPTDEVADEILALASARQRLPGRAAAP